MVRMIAQSPDRYDGRQAAVVQKTSGGNLGRSRRAVGGWLPPAVGPLRLLRPVPDRGPGLQPLAAGQPASAAPAARQVARLDRPADGLDGHALDPGGLLSG